MAEYEREIRTTTTEGDPAYVRTRTTTGDDHVTVVRRGSSATPWLIAAIVAVAAIIAIAFLMRDNDEPNANDLAAAVDAGRAAGYVEGAATAVDNMPPLTTTVPVPYPVPTDNGYAERSAAEAAAAAADARDAAERAADSAASANDPDTSVSNTTP